MGSALPAKTPEQQRREWSRFLVAKQTTEIYATFPEQEHAEEYLRELAFSIRWLFNQGPSRPGEDAPPAVRLVRPAEEGGC